jgi:hypothetical protein
MEQLHAQTVVDGFTVTGYILACGFAAVVFTNLWAIAYLMKIHKAVKKPHTP